MALSATDPVSHANSEEYVTDHLALDWAVDFDRRIIRGCATLRLRNLSRERAPLKLDTKYLNITEVMVQGEKVDFTLSDCQVKVLGSCLTIPIKSVDNEVTVVIVYETTDQCSALQWLPPALTKGKKYPYLFSQCQAIHGRSLFPCQDSPSVKFTYSAKVRAPKDLEVLMSAVKDKHVVDEQAVRVHSFKQHIRVPSYLLALVCGNLEGRKVGPRSTVWSEPEMVDEAAKEFEDTEKFLSMGENICGPYVWGVYDLLVLPPSFPYGGMENPCLTFVTPTLLVGDKSLVCVIAHEIAHSWTGNLVTNKTWEDFWLNEGHTMYVERLIMEKYYGENEGMRHLLIEAGLAELQESLNDYGANHPFNQMIPKLEGMDPDDAFSLVPYEKGSNLLFHLEGLCGKEPMLRWLRTYVAKYKDLSLSTEEWKKFFYEHMTTVEKVDISKLDRVRWKEWFYGRGEIPEYPKLQNELGKRSVDLADEWINLTTISEKDEKRLLDEYKSMEADQKYYFLQFLNEFKNACLPHEKLELMDRLYEFTSSRNSEILFGWSLLSIRGKYEPALDQVFQFLNSQGRLKYTKPIYKALRGWSQMESRTMENFNDNRDKLHPITSHGVQQILGLSLGT